MPLFELNHQDDLIKSFDQLAIFSKEEKFTDTVLANGRKTYQALNEALVNVCYDSGWNGGHTSLNSITKLSVISALNEVRQRNVGRLGNLVVGKRKFPVHLFWLAAQSETIRNDLLKSAQDEQVLPDWYPEAVVNAVIDFLYTGTMKMNCDLNNMLALIDMAKRLDIQYVIGPTLKWLRSQCTAESWVRIKTELESLKLYDDANAVVEITTKGMKQWLNEGNWLTIYQNAHEQNTQQILSIVFDYVSRNFEKLRQDSAMLKLPVEHITNILNMGSLSFDTEQSVAEFVLEWGKYSSTERKCQLKDLFVCCVRMQHLSIEFINDKLLASEMVHADGGLQEHCRMARKVLKDPKRLNDPDMRSRFPKPRLETTNKQNNNPDDAVAENALGENCYFGRGVPLSTANAFVWFLKAAEKGLAAAQSNLGLLYETGRGAAKSIETAHKWYRRAAEQGYAPAQFAIGLMYERGAGLQQSNAEACTWYLKAVEQHHPDAHQQLESLVSAGAATFEAKANMHKWLAMQTNQEPTATTPVKQNELAQDYFFGRTVPQSFRQAAKWFQIAASAGLAEAQYNLGRMYNDGKGVAQLDQEAVSWYRRAAEQGNKDGQHGLSWMYWTGRGVAQSNEQAARWCQKAAEQGDAISQNSLGCMYRDGTGVPQSHDQAMIWYHKAASQALAIAHANLGLMYEHGKGVVQSYETAFVWYSKAAELGCAMAQTNVGQMYLSGKGVVQSAEEAVNWLHKAAGQGHAEGQTTLARQYADGNGVARSYEEAAKLWRKAAAQGVASAQCSLGDVHRVGHGVAQSNEEAIRWYGKAAAQGDASAAYNLGVMYENGTGVAPSRDEAVKWYRKAADAGHEQAKSSVKQLCKKKSICGIFKRR